MGMADQPPARCCVSSNARGSAPEFLNAMRPNAVSSIPRSAVVVSRWSTWRRIITRDITIIRVRMMPVRAKLRAMSWPSHDCGMTNPHRAHSSRDVRQSQGWGMSFVYGTKVVWDVRASHICGMTADVAPARHVRTVQREVLRDVATVSEPRDDNGVSPMGHVSNVQPHVLRDVTSVSHPWDLHALRLSIDRRAARKFRGALRFPCETGTARFVSGRSRRILVSNVRYTAECCGRPPRSRLRD